MMVPSIYSRSRDDEVATVTIRRNLSTNSVVSSPSTVIATKTSSPHHVAHVCACRVPVETGAHEAKTDLTRLWARRANGSFPALILR
jgi:hypothetical protein